MNKLEGMEKYIQNIVTRFNGLGNNNINLGNLGPEVSSMI
jgi:hypothetical protein